MAKTHRYVKINNKLPHIYQNQLTNMSNICNLKRNNFVLFSFLRKSTGSWHAGSTTWPWCIRFRVARDRVYNFSVLWSEVLPQRLNFSRSFWWDASASRLTEYAKVTHWSSETNAQHCPNKCFHVTRIATWYFKIEWWLLNCFYAHIWSFDDLHFWHSNFRKCLTLPQ